MHGYLADISGGAWSFGGSMITFVFPMILFIAVAATLYVLYTKPSLVPGHKDARAERSVSHTYQPGEPTVAASGEPQARTATAATTTEAEE